MKTISWISILACALALQVGCIVENHVSNEPPTEVPPATTFRLLRIDPVDRLERFVPEERRNGQIPTVIAVSADPFLGDGHFDCRRWWVLEEAGLRFFEHRAIAMNYKVGFYLHCGTELDLVQTCAGKLVGKHTLYGDQIRFEGEGGIELTRGVVRSDTLHLVDLSVQSCFSTDGPSYALSNLYWVP